MPDYSGFGGGSNFGADYSTTRTWSDPSGSVTTNPNTGSISWNNHDGGSGSFNEAASQGQDFSLSALFKNLLNWNREKDTVTTPQSLENSLNSIDPTTISQSLTLDNQDPNKGALGLFQDKTSLGYRLGLRDPGSLAARNFFEHQTEAEQADRMGLVGNAIDTIGGAAVRAMTPAPVSVALGLSGIYDAYQKDGNLQNAIYKGLTSTGGYGAALGNALQGNWGASLSSLLGKHGVDPMTSAALGTGVDVATGKSATPATYGSLAGYFAGKAAGGPVGAVFGSNVGRSLGSLYSGKK